MAPGADLAGSGRLHPGVSDLLGPARAGSARNRRPSSTRSVGRIKISLAQEAAATETEEEPTTAEQAVPWLIGVILLLAGMVIVLLALIFAGDGSLGGVAPSGSALALVPSTAATPSVEPRAVRHRSCRRTARRRPLSSQRQRPRPSRSTGRSRWSTRVAAPRLAPIYLLRRDFTQALETQAILAQDADVDVRRFAWSPDGTVGVGLLADVLVSIEPGAEKRRLADGISTITFGDDASTVYAVRVTEDGANDVATVLAIDFLSGDTTELAAPTYARPDIGAEEAAGRGGVRRRGWCRPPLLGRGRNAAPVGARGWNVADRSRRRRTDRARQPTRARCSGRRTPTERITTTFADGSTTISLLDEAGEVLITRTVAGRVSHLRWAPDGERVVFTLGHAGAGGGVLQDLFLWDLNDADPMQLTATGAAFGAEWLGTQPLWRE